MPAGGAVTNPGPACTAVIAPPCPASGRVTSSATTSTPAMSRPTTRAARQAAAAVAGCTSAVTSAAASGCCRSRPRRPTVPQPPGLRRPPAGGAASAEDLLDNHGGALRRHLLIGRLDSSTRATSIPPTPGAQSSDFTTTGKPISSAASRASSALGRLHPAGTGRPQDFQQPVCQLRIAAIPSAMALVRSVSVAQIRRWPEP